MVNFGFFCQTWMVLGYMNKNLDCWSYMDMYFLCGMVLSFPHVVHNFCNLYCYEDIVIYKLIAT
jgi:hypothetical protein